MTKFRCVNMDKRQRQFLVNNANWRQAPLSIKQNDINLVYGHKDIHIYVGTYYINIHI